MMIEIPKRIESQNVYNKWHWSKRAGNGKRSEKMSWYWNILSACGRRARKPYLKAYILSFRKGRLLDEANLIGGAKPLVDALVDAGLLKDDDVESCKIHYYQHKKVRDEKTILYFPECAKEIINAR